MVVFHKKYIRRQNTCGYKSYYFFAFCWSTIA